MNTTTPYVLYVDDDEANLVVFEAGVQGELPVLTAKNASVALELLHQHEVAVLLTDQRMPGMSGVDLMEVARREHPETIRMLITAYSDLDVAIDAINRGQVDIYLRKPWEPAELTQSLRQARDRYLLNRRMRELESRLVQTERLYALGMVAAGIAHELRNPLTSLSMGLRVLRVELEKKTHADTDRMWPVLMEAEEAVKVITDITKSIDLSTRSNEDADVNLQEVVELAARSVRGEMRRHGRMELKLDKVPPVRGSRTRLGQVVMNLLVNAMQALDPEAYGRNQVRVALGHLADPSGGKVTLEVSDNGSGIPPEVMSRIFDPFFTTKVQGGTGLGLAISRQIVREHGGEIEVRSAVGDGTRFSVTFPIGKAEA